MVLWWRGGLVDLAEEAAQRVVRTRARLVRRESVAAHIESDRLARAGTVAVVHKDRPAVVIAAFVPIREYLVVEKRLRPLAHEPDHRRLGRIDASAQHLPGDARSFAQRSRASVERPVTR